MTLLFPVFRCWRASAQTAEAWLPRSSARSRHGAGGVVPVSRVAPGAEVATLLINGAVAVRINPGGE